MTAGADPGAGVPEWERVAAALRHDLLSGALPPGVPIVSSRVRDRHATTIADARIAMRALQEEGLLRGYYHGACWTGTRDPAASARMGQALARLRHDAGLAVEDLAAAAGLRPHAITRAETGEWQARDWFWRPADQALGADGTLLRLHDQAYAPRPPDPREDPGPEPGAGDPPAPPERSRHAGVTDAIRARITGGEWAPGARLIIGVLARQHGTTPMGARLALLDLVPEGLVSHRPREGFYRAGQRALAAAQPPAHRAPPSATQDDAFIPGDRPPSPQRHAPGDHAPGDHQHQHGREVTRMGDLQSIRYKVIGAWLHRYREGAGLGLDDPAAALGCDRSKISRIESGDRSITPAELGKLLDLYDPDPGDRAALATLAGVRRAGSWADQYRRILSPSYRDITATEEAATAITIHAPLAIPEILQSPGYARTITTADPSVPPEILDIAVNAVMTRQDAILRQRAIPTEAIIGEAALLAIPGGPRARHAQIAHLQDRAAYCPALTIRVLPLHATAIAARGAGGFTILRFSHAPAPALALLDSPADCVYLYTPDTVALYTSAFTSIQRHALTPDQSAQRLKEIAGLRGV